MGARHAVGNISYDVTEDQLNKLFAEAGRVKSLRMVFDKETGKPKGYGFCEFFDRPTAECAVRNLNNHEIGGRQLRVGGAA